MVYYGPAHYRVGNPFTHTGLNGNVLFYPMLPYEMINNV